MRILHLANDYSGSTVYKNLCLYLDKLGVEQIVYTPIRMQHQKGQNKIQFINNESRIFYKKTLNNYTRLNFYHKIRKINNDLLKTIPNISQIKVIHAHTLFSDGAVAYKLFKKFGTPYIVTIRNTDLNLFIKYMVHLRKLGIQILQNAKKIIFISTVYKKRFQNLSYMKDHIKSIENKLLVIPNGVDFFWIKNSSNRKERVNYPVQLLFIGNFGMNKNIGNLIDAVNLLNNKGGNYILNLVGGGRENKSVSKQITQNKFVKFYGAVYDKNKIRNIIRNSDIFTMPSKTETFGLVYIESLSQGIPVLYTKGEGIDEMYNNIGEVVDANSVTSISNGIKKICNNYTEYDFLPKEIVSNHDWNKIANQYHNIYQTII